MKSKKTIRVILASVSVVILIPIIFAGKFFYLTKFAKTEVLTSSSDDGTYSLTVYMIGEPDWPFGSTHCRFDLYEGNKRIIRYPFDVQDDGAMAWEGKVTFSWREEYVAVHVSGSEQDDEAYRLKFDGSVEKVTGKKSSEQDSVNMEGRIYGITVDDCWYDDVETDAVIAAIRDMPVKPTVRIVMSKEIRAADYKVLFSKLHEVAYVMACPVDSSDMSFYENEEAYMERFRDAYNELSSYTDLWEIGNEINGTEWIGKEPELIIRKVEAANAYIRSHGAKTALTMYYLRPEDQDMFKWMKDNLSEELTNNIDFALISYYEDDNEGFIPEWNKVFPAFETVFPGAMVGIGECGNTSSEATESDKVRMAKAYYSMEKLSENFIGGCFWWNWVEDCVPHEGNAVYEEINRVIALSGSL